MFAVQHKITNMAELQLMVRDASIQDLPALADLMNQLGYPTSLAEMGQRFNAIDNHADYKSFVVAAANEVIAMAGTVTNYFYEQNGCYVRIVAFVVNAAYRNKGAGTALLQHIESGAKEAGASAVVLNCGNRAERQQAHKFYQNNGYQIKSSEYFKKL